MRFILNTRNDPGLAEAGRDDAMGPNIGLERQSAANGVQETVASTAPMLTGQAEKSPAGNGWASRIWWCSRGSNSRLISEIMAVG